MNVFDQKLISHPQFDTTRGRDRCAVADSHARQITAQDALERRRVRVAVVDAQPVAVGHAAVDDCAALAPPLDADAGTKGRLIGRIVRQHDVNSRVNADGSRWQLQRLALRDRGRNGQPQRSRAVGAVRDHAVFPRVNRAGDGHEIAQNICRGFFGRPRRAIDGQQIAIRHRAG